MRKITRQLHFFIIVALILAGCNLPSNNPKEAELASTFAAQTVEALLQASPTAANISTTTATLTPVPLPTNTPVPSPTATPVCPQAQFITDVTVPDGTVMTPGQTFTKKWRLKNTGTCAWNGYTLVFDSGDAMGGPATQPVGAVNPGQEIDIEVNMTAPASAGNYREVLAAGIAEAPMVGLVLALHAVAEIETRREHAARNDDADDETDDGSAQDRPVSFPGCHCSHP